jgi:protein involved in polysaccharide export with SLBB domain
MPTATMNRAPISALLLAAAVLAAAGLTGCATVKRLTPDLSNVKVPLPPLPKFSTLKKITNVIPGLPDSDSAAVDDPKVPFNSRGTLGYGHTLRLDIYEGARNTKRIYKGVVMIDEKGVLDFGEVGTTRVGGSTLPQAVESIAAIFRVGGRITRPITVHILSVEDVPVVSITGDVLKDEFIPAWEDMTVDQAVRVAGGRKLESENRGVYLTRAGNRRYFPSLEAANREEPEPGDIITLSTDL